MQKLSTIYFEKNYQNIECPKKLIRIDFGLKWSNKNFN